MELGHSLPRTKGQTSRGTWAPGGLRGRMCPCRTGLAAPFLLVFIPFPEKPFGKAVKRFVKLYFVFANLNFTWALVVLTTEQNTRMWLKGQPSALSQ